MENGRPVPLRGPVGVPGRPGLGGGGETIAFAGFGCGFATTGAGAAPAEASADFGAATGFTTEPAAGFDGAVSVTFAAVGAALFDEAEAGGALDISGSAFTADAADFGAAAEADLLGATTDDLAVVTVADAGLATDLLGVDAIAGADGLGVGAAAFAVATPAGFAAPAAGAEGGTAELFGAAARGDAADFAGMGAAVTAALRGARGTAALLAPLSAPPGFAGFALAGGFMPDPTPSRRLRWTRRPTRSMRQVGAEHVRNTAHRTNC